MKSCCREAFDNGTPEPPDRRKGLRSWLKRLGVAGFVFFLVKGIVWLVIFWGGAELIGCD